jgi:ketosteroid isomerase-like protein
MSEENVEVVREAYAALNRGDAEAVAAALHPDVEWRAYLSALEARVYRGPTAILEMWSTLDEGFGGTLFVEVHELIDRGEQVVAVVSAGATGRGSSATVEQRWAQLVTMKDALIFRVEPFPSRAAALEGAEASAP